MSSKTSLNKSESSSWATQALPLALMLALGIGAPRSLLALPEDADQPINIRANEGELDRVSRTGIYRGEVQVDQGTLRIKADTMTVEYKDQKVTRITFNGNPATYQQQLNADEEMVFANAKTIVYYTQNEKLELEGDAFLTQQGNELRGEQIDYDIVAGKVDADSAGKGPINIILQPDRAP